MDTNKIDKIDTELVLPSIQENLIEIERDKWGNILNEQTFKTINNNMKVMKEILLEIANEINVTNLDSIKLRLNNLETDRDSIESIVDNNTNGLINVGITERKLNLKGTELEFNGNKIDTNNIVYNNDLTNVAYTNRKNIFNENIDNNKLYKLKGGNVLEKVDNKIKVGNISNKLDLQTTNGTFLVNGQEFNITGGGSGNGISEIIKIRSSSIQLSHGEILAFNNITFSKAYDNPPLIIATPLNSIPLPAYLYEEARHITLHEVTTTGFKYAMSTDLANFDFYFIIIPTDGLNITTI